MRIPAVLLRYLCLAVPVMAGAASLLARSMELEDMFRLHRVSDPQISPDGSSVVSTIGSGWAHPGCLSSAMWRYAVAAVRLLLTR